MLNTGSWLAGLCCLALGLLAWGHYIGLVVAPPDREMGEVQRIMYVHVPAVWVALVALTLNFIASVTYLLKPSWKTASGSCAASTGHPGSSPISRPIPTPMLLWSSCVSFSSKPWPFRRWWA